MALFPLLLVILATIFSTAYRHCSHCKLSSDCRRALIKIHAFGTELLQLLILITGIVVAWTSFASKTIMLDIHIISNFPVPAWFAATLRICTYVIAVLAVDLIDNRIQLGCWQHPVQIQTLLLTRASLVSWSVKKRRRSAKHSKSSASAKKQAIKKNIEPVSTAPYRRKRTTSEPVTPEMLRRFLREIPVEVSKSGALIREARAYARRASSAATMPGENAVLVPRTPEEVGRRYAVQSKVEVIERVVGESGRSVGVE